MSAVQESNCPHCERLIKAKAGQLTSLVAETENVIVIAGDHQYFLGYCVVIAKVHIREMHHLPAERAQAIFMDVMAVGRTLEAAFHCHKMNYVSLGNVDEHLHWHVIPRYLTDPDHREQPWKNAKNFGDIPTTPETIANLKRIFAEHNF